MRPLARSLTDRFPRHIKCRACSQAKGVQARSIEDQEVGSAFGLCTVVTCVLRTYFSFFCIVTLPLNVFVMCCKVISCNAM